MLAALAARLERELEQILHVAALEHALEIGGTVVLDLDPAGAAILFARADAHTRCKTSFEAPLQLLHGWRGGAGALAAAALRRRSGQRLDLAHRQPPFAHQRRDLHLLFQ